MSGADAMEEELRAFIDRVAGVYESSPNPARDLDASGVVARARSRWDNADQIVETVAGKVFEKRMPRWIFQDYLIFSIDSIYMGIDNGFRAGAYEDRKLNPYVDRYIEHLKETLLRGWQVSDTVIRRALPNIILSGDIMAHQAVWEYSFAVNYEFMAAGDWDITETFIYDLCDNPTTRIMSHDRGQAIEGLIDKHFVRDGRWLRLRAESRVEPELRYLFKSLRRGPAVQDVHRRPEEGQVTSLDF